MEIYLLNTRRDIRAHRMLLIQSDNKRKCVWTMNCSSVQTVARVWLPISPLALSLVLPLWASISRHSSLFHSQWLNSSQLELIWCVIFACYHLISLECVYAVAMKRWICVMLSSQKIATAAWMPVSQPVNQPHRDTHTSFSYHIQHFSAFQPQTHNAHRNVTFYHIGVKTRNAQNFDVLLKWWLAAPPEVATSHI